VAGVDELLRRHLRTNAVAVERAEDRTAERIVPTR
jgi:hypothetical protein